MYDVQVLADSVSPDGHRITTLVVTFPRFILAEFNTHRMLSRNAASSRAIPISVMINQVKQDPFIPEDWGTFRQGMVAGPALTGEMVVGAVLAWKYALQYALIAAEALSDLKVHKSLVNRLLEPFMWTTVVVTATDWRNFFHLRTRPEAQPEFRIIALRMQDALETSTPEPKGPGEWHLPFIREEDRLLGIKNLVRISAARCARVSYLTHAGKREPFKDLDLASRLLKDGHMSPFEHPAFCQTTPRRLGNFTGWTQYRKLIQHEDDPKGVR